MTETLEHHSGPAPSDEPLELVAIGGKVGGHLGEEGEKGGGERGGAKHREEGGMETGAIRTHPIQHLQELLDQCPQIAGRGRGLPHHRRGFP